MKRLKREDAFHLEAAEGWLELGNHLEANEELDRITAKYRVHPDVLEMRWRVYQRAERWEMCLEIAETLADQGPRRANTWLLLASTLHCMQQDEDACETLIKVMDEFPENPEFAFKLACYFSCLGELEEALKWLEAAMKINTSKEFKRLALDEPMLVPLWKRIGELRPGGE